MTRRQGERKRGTSVHRRQPPTTDDPLVQDHEMGEQPNQTSQLPIRSRASTLVNRGGQSTRVNLITEGTQDHDMGEPDQANSQHQQPTRGRAINMNRGGAGINNDRVNSNPESQVNSTQRAQSHRQDDHRQNRAVPSSRRNPDEYDETDRDEVEVPEVRTRGRSRAPSQHPDVFQAPAPQQTGRGRPTGPARNQVYNQSPRQDEYQDDRQLNQPPQDDRGLNRPPPQGRHRDQRPTLAEVDSRVLQAQAPLGYRGSIPQHLREEKITRSRSMEPSKGIHDVLVNQIVSAVSEENAVLVSSLPRLTSNVIPS